MLSLNQLVDRIKRRNTHSVHRVLRSIQFASQLEGWHVRENGLVVPKGILSFDSVTDAGVAFMVDAFQNTTEIETFNQHDAGTGTGAEAVGNTTLGTPWGGARVAGTQSEPAANQYRTTATIPFTGTFAITEHGLFSAAAAGTLWDRSMFSGSTINVVNGDSIAFQYTLTLTSGG
jgi:hypothetical protein